ncbi:MAG: GNAT family N-acetyltransferase [Anaerolineaceae bacterium]|nr:GNAT family N-acetyltransferase [Anaerolineaceae bacterium]
MDYQLLTWDTEFFGIKTGRIIPASLQGNQLASILAEMRQKGFQLVYWASKCQYAYNFQLYSNQLVDKKTTFKINLQNIHLDKLPQPRTEPYSSSFSYAQLEKIAIQSGIFSRFALDKNFPHEKFIALYKTWIRKSVSGEMADEVLVILDNKNIAGMVTLSYKGVVGDIGLIAVEKKFRGRKLGQQLVWDAQRKFIQHGCHTARVITQGDNLPACLLYEKCGYQKTKVEFYYHFWL